MCTAIALNCGELIFGRNMDIECSFNEKIVIVPRNFAFNFKCEEKTCEGVAFIGMASVIDNYPLFADGVNEFGLAIAGLNFPNFCQHNESQIANCINLAPYEVIPYLLSSCKTVMEAEKILEKLNIVAIKFKEDIPLVPLHFILSDKDKSVVIEMTKNGLEIFENPVGILTNSPNFEFHLNNLSNFLHCSPSQPKNKLTTDLNLQPFGVGSGGMGLLGDFSSPSRFVKAVFSKSNSTIHPLKMENIYQMFHILDTVKMVHGNVLTEGEKIDYTIYQSCMTGSSEYFYKTYFNSNLFSVSLFESNLDSKDLIVHKLLR